MPPNKNKRRRRANRNAAGKGGNARQGQQRQGQGGKRPQRTPQQRRRRARRRQLDRTLYNPAAVLGGKQLRKSVNQLVRGEIKPQVNEINRQIGHGRRQGDLLSERAGSYYRDLATQEQSAIDGTRAISERLNTTLAGIDQGGAQQITQAQTAAATAMDADAEARGEGLDGGAREQLAREIAAQQAAQATSGTAFRSAGAVQGAGYEGLAQMAKIASASRGADAQAQIANSQQQAEQDLLAQRQEVREQQGPLRTKLLMQLRQAGFEQLATQLGLDLSREELQAEMAQAEMRDKTTRRGQRIAARTQRRGQNITRRGQDVSAETQRRGQDIVHNDRVADRKLRERLDASDGGSGRKDEPASAKTMKRGIENVLRKVDRMRNNGRGYDQIEKQLWKSDTEPLMIEAALQLLRNRGLSSETVKALKRTGMHIPPGWRPKQRPSGRSGWGDRTP